MLVIGFLFPLKYNDFIANTFQTQTKQGNRQ